MLALSIIEGICIGEMLIPVSGTIELLTSIPYYHCSDITIEIFIFEMRKWNCCSELMGHNLPTLPGRLDPPVELFLSLNL